MYSTHLIWSEAKSLVNNNYFYPINYWAPTNTKQTKFAETQALASGSLQSRGSNSLLANLGHCSSPRNISGRSGAPAVGWEPRCLQATVPMPLLPQILGHYCQSFLGLQISYLPIAEMLHTPFHGSICRSRNINLTGEQTKWKPDLGLRISRLQGWLHRIPAEWQVIFPSLVSTSSSV